MRINHITVVHKREGQSFNNVFFDRTLERQLYFCRGNQFLVYVTFESVIYPNAKICILRDSLNTGALYCGDKVDFATKVLDLENSMNLVFGAIKTS